jgi:adenylosuccinate synthase
MSAVVIVGAQWGDEGKGKIVDLYTESADVVVRFAGGPNAGHTLVVGNDRLIVRLIPSGILRPQARCVMAQGMAIDPHVFVSELELLQARGISTKDRLFVSDRAHLILPYHVLVDALRETAPGNGPKLGTTKKGIGPCYEDKAARRGIRIRDLCNLDHLRTLATQASSAWAPIIRALGGEAPDARTMMAELEPLAEKIVPLIADTSMLVDRSIRGGERVLFEGAQGTLLDLDHGTYPYVTSSSAVAGGACTGTGIGPTRIKRAIGITKGYATRVGEGPFPTELTGALGDALRNAGSEFGSVTGRPRRTGWLDLPALRYAARVNGLDGLAVTKLDAMAGLSPIQVCVAYETKEGRTEELPIDDLDSARPIYENLPGWTEPLAGARALADLPATVRDYLRFLEDATGLSVFVASVGPRREETIIVRDAFD